MLFDNSRRLSPWKHAFTVFAFFLVIYLLFFSPVIFFNKALVPGDGWRQNFPTYNSPTTLWTTFLFSGYPALADIQTQSFYPFSLFLSQLPYSWNFFLILAYVLSGCFTYGYLLMITGSRLASLAGGIIFSMNGAMIANLRHSNLLHTVLWMPLLLWSLEVLRKKFSLSWFLTAVLTVSISVFAGHPQIFVYTFGLSAIYALVRGFHAPPGRWKYYGQYLLIIITGLAIASVQLLPTAELASLTPRSEIDYNTFISGSLPLKQSLAFLFPNIFGTLADSFYAIPYFGSAYISELSIYIGLLTLMLAACGLSACRKDPLIRFWFIAAVVLFLVILGDITPLGQLLYHTPGYNKFRIPARHFFEFALAISVLASCAIAAIEKGEISRRKIWITVITSAVVMLACASFIAVSGEEFLKIKTLDTSVREQIGLLPWSNPAIAVPLLIFACSSTALLYWSRKSGSLLRKILLLSFLITDLGSFGWFQEWKYFSDDYDLLMYPPAHVQRYKTLLNAEKQRILTIREGAASLNEIPANLAMLWEVPIANGYNPLILNRQDRMLKLIRDKQEWLLPENRIRDILAIRYITFPSHRNRTTVIEKRGLSWLYSDSPFILGSGCGVVKPEKTTLTVTNPMEATHIGIVSSLACSQSVNDNTEVLRVLLRGTDGTSTPIRLYAGRDTSESAYGCNSTQQGGQPRHARAEIFEELGDIPGGCKADNYLAVLPLTDTGRIREIEIQATSSLIRIDLVSLKNSKTGASSPVSLADSRIAASIHLRHVEDVGATSIYENLQAAPRVWLVPEAASLEPQEIFKAISTSKMPDGNYYDPLRTALVEEDFTFKAEKWDENGSSRIKSISGTKMEISYNSGSESFLVLSDTYYPGWRAYIDDTQTHIFQTNYTLRGIVVPPGEHVVRFEYRPKSFYLGAGISLTSLLFLLGFAVLRVWKR